MGDVSFFCVPKSPSGFASVGECLVCAAREGHRRRTEGGERDARRSTEGTVGLGSLASGLCHEINNPLASIVGFAELYVQGLESDAMVCMSSVLQASGRIRAVVDAMAAFALGASHSHAGVDLPEAVRTALRMQQAAFASSGTHACLDAPPDAPTVAGDPQALVHAFSVLVENARLAMAEAPSRVLSVWIHVLKEAVRVEFEDTGPGVPKELRARVFDPFFTTRPPGQGMGMGLAIAHRVIEDHGGKIWVEAGSAGGALFIVELPRASS
jgi:C4-dicarboxylate-specific signal transduction histidine kinase